MLRLETLLITSFGRDHLWLLPLTRDLPNILYSGQYILAEIFLDKRAITRLLPDLPFLVEPTTLQIHRGRAPTSYVRLALVIASHSLHSHVEVLGGAGSTGSQLVGCFGGGGGSGVGIGEGWLFVSLLVFVNKLTWVSLVARILARVHDDHLSGIICTLIFLFVPFCDRRFDDCPAADQLLDFLDILLVVELVWLADEEVFVRGSISHSVKRMD